jgi:hypothetical protein
VNREATEADFSKLFTGDDGKLYIGGLDDDTGKPIFKPVLKGWESMSGWYWFAVEKVEERKVAEGGGSIINGREVDDVLWYGLVQGFEEEWGNFSEAEIKSLGPYVAWPIKKCDLPHAGRRDRSR